MTTDTSLLLWIMFMLGLMALAGHRSSPTVQPPQIVYVQAEEPRNSGGTWLLLIIVVFLTLKAVGVV